MTTRTPAYRSTDETGAEEVSKSAAVRPIVVAVAFSLLLVTLWALTHRYRAFARDGELYAVQALARIHPALGTDLYLQNTSQDHYTIFSRIYGSFIGAFGLQTAELLLFLSCTVGFLAGAWVWARELSTAEEAWVAVALLIITVGYYGAYQIFSYSENYLTARSMGEALIIVALACHFRGWRALALSIGVAALFVHPLMALPGVLLLICLWLPIRLAIVAAAAGVLATLMIALTALMSPVIAKFVTVMDPAWVEVVRERSQFLFLKYWTAADWENAARPFVCLTVTAMALPDERTRKLALSAMLVGASGVAVAFVASSVGPVAILLQGQAWRWVWITGVTSVLLLAPTAWQVWRDAKCGPLCATLLVLAWTYSGVDTLACADAALALWLLRARLTERTALHLRWAAFSIIAVIVAWVLANCWTFASSPIPESGRESLVVARIRELFALGVSAVLLVGLFWYWIRSVRSTWVICLVSAFFLATSLLILPGSLKQLETVGTRAEIDEFADWRDAIPPASNVLMLPTSKSASFMWFTLGRPSYWSVGQSAGVVFSRATSLEVKRRSDVLLPLADPDWRILTQIMEQSGSRHKPGSVTASNTSSRPLTDKILVSVCGDPQLGFVIAKEHVGLDPMRHLHIGAWKDWNLYDCRRVRSTSPGA